MSSTDEIVTTVLGFAESQGIDAERGARDGEVVLVLPGEHKLKTVCSLLAGEHDLSASAFVIRHADENHEGFYRYLLRRNLRMRGVSYAIDGSGDVYAVARLPLSAVDEAGLDRLLGALLEAADDAFDELLTLGFLTSMKREWDWRVARGESLRNLQAFAHLLDPDVTPRERYMTAGDDRHDLGPETSS